MTAVSMDTPTGTAPLTKAKHERPPRPELTEDQLIELEQLLSVILGTGNADPAGDMDPTIFQRFSQRLFDCSEALILDARHRQTLMTKLRQTRDKSNRRRSQLRQQNKTIELMNKRAQGLHVAVINLSKDCTYTKEQLREEQALRRRAETELYQLRDAMQDAKMVAQRSQP